ncbi:1-acyl-sn-glycerol-3-phosphate acyltransferase [Patescibacteria group bacterium]|nr:1-acyl-sn-glycerol-3-phosphate acyltransferase [Patescibacteria group bacterium]
MKRLYFLPPLILQTIIWIPTRIYFKLVHSYSVQGLKNLKRLKHNKNGVIFAVNHSSELDPIMIPASLPFLSHMMPMFYVSREKKFYDNSGWRQHIYGGRFFNAWGAYTVYTGLKNYDLSLKHHIKILNDGRSVCIFPEGRKTRDGNIGEGKPGTSFLSYKTNSPIVPVRINGLYKPLVQKDKLGRTKIEVIFGEPIYPKDLFGSAISENSEEGKDISIEEFKRTREVVMDSIRNL